MSDWDKPGVAATIESYWSSSHAEKDHRVWLASAVAECARPPMDKKVCVHRRHGLNLIATQVHATDKRE